mmetsp:Transcript_9106/g.17850  ORF Transcript_9106/g.17850 Transcript_9106/m.17850 type:complete len:287 (-) Transcript_9106:604-1464(-)
MSMSSLVFHKLSLFDRRFDISWMPVFVLDRTVKDSDGTVGMAWRVVRLPQGQSLLRGPESFCFNLWLLLLPLCLSSPRPSHVCPRENSVPTRGNEDVFFPVRGVVLHWGLHSCTMLMVRVWTSQLACFLSSPRAWRSRGTWRRDAAWRRAPVVHPGHVTGKSPWQIARQPDCLGGCVDGKRRRGDTGEDCPWHQAWQGGCLGWVGDGKRRERHKVGCLGRDSMGMGWEGRRQLALGEGETWPPPPFPSPSLFGRRGREDFHHVDRGCRHCERGGNRRERRLHTGRD